MSFLKSWADISEGLDNYFHTPNPYMESEAEHIPGAIASSIWELVSPTHSLKTFNDILDGDSRYAYDPNGDIWDKGYTVLNNARDLSLATAGLIPGVSLGKSGKVAGKVANSIWNTGSKELNKVATNVGEAVAPKGPLARQAGFTTPGVAKTLVSGTTGATIGSHFFPGVIGPAVGGAIGAAIPNYKAVGHFLNEKKVPLFYGGLGLGTAGYWGKDYAINQYNKLVNSNSNNQSNRTVTSSRH